VVDRAGLALADIDGLGMALPGIIDVEAGRVVSVNEKYPDAPSLDLVGWAEAELGLPAVLENDARAALIGEWQYGAGRGCRDLVVVTLGTGIGVGVLTDGTVRRGAHGAAGILGGHLTVEVAGRRCNCGNVGCAEAEASTWALPDLAAEQPGFGSSPLRQRATIDYRAVYELAAEEDPTAVALRERSHDVWAALIVDLIHAYDPERIVVGGGVARAGGLLAALQERVDRLAWTPTWSVPLVEAELGDNAALLGVSWLVRSPGRR
jgi:glucokinase